MSTTSKKRKHSGEENQIPVAPSGKFYAVRAGMSPGVYGTWEQCQQQTVGFKGASYKSFPSYQLAQDFVAGKAAKNASDMRKPNKFYGVAVGHVPGVYTEWAGGAQEQVTNVKGPKYRKFDTREEAEAFVKSGGKAVPKPAVDKKATKKTAVVNEDEGEEDVLAVEEPRKKKAKVTAGKNDGRKVVVYTDGSSRGNGKVGALAGVGVYFGDGDSRNVSEPLKGTPQTNQRAELTAILRALQIVPQTMAMEIITDSNYSINCCTWWYKNWKKNGWKSSTKTDVMNKDLIVDIREILDKRNADQVVTEFTWVKGHNEDAGNEAADALAVAGAMCLRSE